VAWVSLFAPSKSYICSFLDLLTFVAFCEHCTVIVLKPPSPPKLRKKIEGTIFQHCLWGGGEARPVKLYSRLACL